MIIIKVVLFVLGLYLTLYSAYLAFLMAVNLLVREKMDGAARKNKQFMVIIPAHNEELLLPRLLESIEKQEYERERIKTVVVADNCTDKTEEIAVRMHVQVLKRKSEEKKGKGYAIRYALDMLKDEIYDAIYIVDADSILDRKCIKMLNIALNNGRNTIQCNNSVLNKDQSWFTRIMDVARTIGNEIIEPAKTKLGLSSHLMGNGMCFSKEIITKHQWNAYSVGEDWEYYSRLVEHGETVTFERTAKVFHQESKDIKQATTQRMRWSSGRLFILYKYGLRIFIQGIKSKNIKKIDASLPLVFPNPSLGINLTILGLVISIVYGYMKTQDSFTIWFSVILSIQLALLLNAVFYTKEKKKNLLAILLAPIFLVWKFGIDIAALFGFGREKWVRTKRDI